MRRVVFGILLLISGFLAVDAASAQGVQGRKVALVVGNGSYRAVTPLINPARDAEAVAGSVRDVGFQVELLLDADRTAMLAAVDRLAQYASGAEVALFFYAGHAMEAGGQNLLLPVNVSAANASEIRRTSVSFAEISSALEGRARTTLIFLDACRDNPLQGSAEAPRAGRSRSGAAQSGSRSLGGSGGLASVSSSSGMLIAFATAPGRVALDGSDRNSPFTQALVRHLKTPGLEVRQLLGEVRKTVREATGGRQVPWDNSSLEGTFYFVPAAAPGRSVAVNRFDGVWSVVFACEAVPAQRASEYVRQFEVVIRNHRLEGRAGVEGYPGHLAWQGDVHEDGTVFIRASGTVGDPRSVLNNPAPGSFVSYGFPAQLGDRSGRGVRTQHRPCTAEFTRR